MKRFALTITFFLFAPFAFAQTPPEPQATQTAATETVAPAPAQELPCMKAEMKSGKDSKIDRFYAASPDKVKQAIIDAMKAIEFVIDEKATTDKLVQGQRKRHFGVMVGSGGENLVVNLAGANEGGVDGTKVSAETKKTFAGRAGQRNWTDAVLGRADCILKASK